MSYKNAFRCRRCPESNSSDGCPMWWEVAEKNTATQEVRVNKGCGYAILPTYMGDLMAASNRPAAAVESIRNEIVKGFAKLTAVVGTQNDPLRLAAGVDSDDEPLRLTNGSA